MWSNLSAAQGNHPKAAELREFLATQMTPAQIVAAQRVAAEWKPNSVATSPADAQMPPKQLEATHRAPKDCSGVPMEDWTLDCALPPKADNAPVSDLDNAECWRDASRQDISCRALTDEFLTSLRWATRPKIVKAMNVEGLEREDGRLHFDSNYSRVSTFVIGGWGSGAVEFIFDDAGQAYIIHAIIFGPNIVPGPYSDRNAEYLWNWKSLPTGCSDLPQSKLPRCNKAR
jgi:hypothetical protein